jgi:hypothetical protein
MTCSVDEVLSDRIRRLSEMTHDELHALSTSIERAYVHVMIEQALRDRAVGVSP